MKSFQQLNVVHDAYSLVLPTSLGLSVTEVYIIAIVATTGFGWIILPIAIGAGFGCMTSMFLHKRILRKLKHDDTE